VDTSRSHLGCRDPRHGQRHFAWAQIARQDADQRQVYLVRKDAADCSGSDVPNVAHYPIEPYGEIKRWYGTLSALPAWQKTLAQTAMPAASAA
jgi:glutathione S-transferase